MWTICSAKLTFFHSGNYEAKLRDPPKNVSDVLEIAYTTQASGSTSPAASLDARSLKRSFLSRTEEENTNATCLSGKSWNTARPCLSGRVDIRLVCTLAKRTRSNVQDVCARECVRCVQQFKFDCVLDQPSWTRFWAFWARNRRAHSRITLSSCSNILQFNALSENMRKDPFKSCGQKIKNKYRRRGGGGVYSKPKQSKNIQRSTNIWTYSQKLAFCGRLSSFIRSRWNYCEVISAGKWTTEFF
jgi:hypothetical protein